MLCQGHFKLRMQTLQSYYIVIFAILNLEEATDYYQTIMVKVYII